MDSGHSSRTTGFALPAMALPSIGLPSIDLGHPAIDAALPGGGLARGALHEVAGAGPAVEHATAAALFVAGILARAVPDSDQSSDRSGCETPGRVLWVLQQADLFAPALAGAGLHPDRVIYVEAGRPAGVLMTLEEALRHGGGVTGARTMVGVVGELTGRLSLTASRRLQLAAEAAGVPAFLLRRSRRFDDPVLAEPCAAVTRWRVAPLPSPPPVPTAPDVPGLARARWRLDLIRCRGGEPGSWTVEACDATGRLGLPADAADRTPATERFPLRHRVA